MRNLILVLIFASILYACKGKSDQPADTDEIIEDSISLSPEQRLVWNAEYDTLKGDFMLRKNISAGDTVMAEQVISDLNELWPNIQMVFGKITGDTIFVSIPNATYLTQQMGSSGPSAYLSLVIYNLTEVNGIRHVRLFFEEGDHASPGLFDRSDFSYVKTVIQ